METTKVQITQSALIQRINRKLKPEWEQLKTARGQYDKPSLGRHYILDFNCNSIERTHVNPEKLGRELGVIQPWEEVK